MANMIDQFDQVSQKVRPIELKLAIKLDKEDPASRLRELAQIRAVELKVHFHTLANLLSKSCNDSDWTKIGELELIFFNQAELSSKPFECLPNLRKLLIAIPPKHTFKHIDEAMLANGNKLGDIKISLLYYEKTHSGELGSFFFCGESETPKRQAEVARFPRKNGFTFRTGGARSDFFVHRF
jgi:hypothetical protein